MARTPSPKTPFPKARPRRSARAAIMDTAASILAQNPGASTSAVAAAAGVGRATFYRYFPTREALIRELTLDVIARTDEVLKPIFSNSGKAEDMLLGMLEAIIPMGDRFHFLANVESTDPEVAEQYQRQIRELEHFVDYAKSVRLFDPGVSTAWIVAAIDAMIWAAWSTVSDGSVAPRDAAKLAFRTLTRGLTD